MKFGDINHFHSIFTKLADFLGLLIRESRIMISFSTLKTSAKIILSSPGKHVIDILLLISFVKMVWITTRWIIAVMINLYSFGDFSVNKLIGYSMSSLSSSIVPKNAISRIKLGFSSPRPTGVRTAGFINSRPESFFYRGLRSTMNNGRITISSNSSVMLQTQSKAMSFIFAVLNRANLYFSLFWHNKNYSMRCNGFQINLSI